MVSASMVIAACAGAVMNPALSVMAVATARSITRTRWCSCMVFPLVERRVLRRWMHDPLAWFRAAAGHASQWPCPVLQHVALQRLRGICADRPVDSMSYDNDTTGAQRPWV